MTKYAYRPALGSSPEVDFADPITRGNIGWWLGNERHGQRVNNIVNQQLNNGVGQSGMTRADLPHGPSMSFDGGANAYVNCGTTTLRMTTSDPFTISWIERFATSPPTFAGICCFMPISAAQRFCMFRDDGAQYGRLAWAPGNSNPMLVAAGAPTIASGVGVTRHWILVSPNVNMTSNSLNGQRLFVDGTEYTVTQNANGLSSQASALSYIGWDGADNKFKGQISNFRLWNRGLAQKELERLMVDPYAGLRRPSARIFTFKATAAAERYDRMFAAM